MCWVNDAPELQPARDTMFEANELERFELYVAPEKFLAHRMLAGWSLAGTKTHGGDQENMPLQHGAIKQVMYGALEMGAPMAVQLIVRWASTKIGDGMCIA